MTQLHAFPAQTSQSHNKTTSRNYYSQLATVRDILPPKSFLLLNLADRNKGTPYCSETLQTAYTSITPSHWNPYMSVSLPDWFSNDSYILTKPYSSPIIREATQASPSNLQIRFDCTAGCH